MKGEVPRIPTLLRRLITVFPRDHAVDLSFIIPPTGLPLPFAFCLVPALATRTCSQFASTYSLAETCATCLPTCSLLTPWCSGRAGPRELVICLNRTKKPFGLMVGATNSSQFLELQEISSRCVRMSQAGTAAVQHIVSTYPHTWP